MYLDETILQSRTTLSLVEFIDEFMKFVEDNHFNQHKEEWKEIERKYFEIKKKANKASKKRSFK